MPERQADRNGIFAADRGGELRSKRYGTAFKGSLTRGGARLFVRTLVGKLAEKGLTTFAIIGLRQQLVQATGYFCHRQRRRRPSPLSLSRSACIALLAVACCE